MATASRMIQTRTTPRPARDRRLLVFRAVAVLLSVGLLFGGMIVFFLLAPWVLVGPTPDDYVAELHRWHHADAGALFAFLIVGSLLALIPDPRRRPVLAQAVLVGLGAMLATSLLDEPSVGAIAPSVVLAAVVVAIYPAPRALVSLRGGGPVSWPLLGLAVATAVPLLVNAWDNLRLQANDHSQHATEHHWSGSAALAIALVVVGFLVAARRPGWQALGAIVGLTYLYLGVAAITVPDHDGSWGTAGGLLALLAGAGFIAGTLVEGRRASRAAGPSTG